MGKRWDFQGDVNLEHGGIFFDLSEWRNGYVTAVEVRDLDSGCGFRGAVLIEERTITIDRPERHASALDAIGSTILPNGDIEDNGRVLSKGSRAWKLCIAYALNAYGFHDLRRSEVLQLERDGPMQFGGWIAADKRLRANANLRRYVQREWLRKL